MKDFHVHTEFSDDSIYPIEEVVKDAIILGIDELCFTDHIDYGVKLEFNDPNVKILNGKKFANVDYPNFYKVFDELSKKYQNQISLRKGFEFGIQKHTIKQFQTLFNSNDFDFIILSIHQVDNKEFWTYEYQEDKTQDEYNFGYYHEFLKVIKTFKDYSVLGHLDMIRRYDKVGKYPFEKIKPIVTEILKQVIKDGKGIEVNTSSFRYNLDDLMPSTDILKLYKELGGNIITIGSDSHKKEHLGSNIEKVMKMLKSLGFETYCSFEKMKAIHHKL